MVIFHKLVFIFNETSIKIPADFFNRNWQADPKIHVEMQGTLNCQDSLEKEESWKTHTSPFQNLLQSYSNQDYAVLP